MTPLTTKQAAVLDYITAWIEIGGRAPAYPEIAAALNESYMDVYRCIVALEAKGYIARQPGKRNSIRLAGQPDPAKMLAALRAIRIKCEQHADIVAICDEALA
jgi:SOS-response transcriptional repressor LexA